MNSERTIEVSVSASNLFSQLYALGIVNDDETIVGMRMNPPVKGLELEKKVWKEGTIVPLQLSIKKEDKKEIA